jgi:hypothetical protein
MHRQLDDLFELWQAAHDELLPGKGQGGSSSSERSIGLNVQALSFIAGNDLLDVLHEWEKLVRSERQLTPPAMVKKLPLDQEIKAAVKFAQVHLTWSGEQPWIGDFATELRDLHGTAMAAARQFAQRIRRIACPSDQADGTACGNSLPIREENLMDVFTCRRCQSEWTTLRLMMVALADPRREVWLDAEAIAGYMGISDRRVRQIAREIKARRKGQLLDFKAILATRTKAIG